MYSGCLSKGRGYKHQSNINNIYIYKHIHILKYIVLHIAHVAVFRINGKEAESV